MADCGYSKAFRLVFDLLGKYADTADTSDAWERCCAEAVEIYDQHKGKPFAPMVSGLLVAVFRELNRLYEIETKQKSNQQSDKDGRYRFTLP